MAMGSGLFAINKRLGPGVLGRLRVLARAVPGVVELQER